MDCVDSDVRKESSTPKGITDNTMIDLGDNLMVSKKTLLKTTSYVQRKAYQFDGEVSFLLHLDKKEEKVTSDHYEPLTFLRSVGYQRNQAKEILEDPIMFTNIYIILKEARLWTHSLKHAQAILLYEAADKLQRGRRAAEYMALVTDAVISGNIPNYDELTAFIKFVEKTENGEYSWDQIIPVSLRKEIKKVPYMLQQYEVEKVFRDTMNLVKQLKEQDDLALQVLQDKEAQDIHSLLESVNQSTLTLSSSSSFDSEKSESDNEVVVDIPLDQKLLKARRAISEKEITKQCCIFANYYDPSMYKYVPLMAHMIARGYFTSHIQIEAVADYLRPICGMRTVRLVELINVALKVSQ